ncbi:hypothetical protein HK097_010945 [Rhizophlyctis rosea]|uniref:Uncharacterized protein n=1 Tax=Rhizophlyctis rosea TaxID=64517 RepID=A0AAD5SHU5_9FUNG|nr:hypothetical protein HK097_010945 [Rhizophlyctis rosea]
MRRKFRKRKSPAIQPPPPAALPPRKRNRISRPSTTVDEDQSPIKPSHYATILNDADAIALFEAAHRYLLPRIKHKFVKAAQVEISPGAYTRKFSLVYEQAVATGRIKLKDGSYAKFGSKGAYVEKPDGYSKKAVAININGDQWHLVNYYKKEENCSESMTNNQNLASVGDEHVICIPTTKDDTEDLIQMLLGHESPPSSPSNNHGNGFVPDVRWDAHTETDSENGMMSERHDDMFYQLADIYHYDPAFETIADGITECYADLPYETEIHHHMNSPEEMDGSVESEEFPPYNTEGAASLYELYDTVCCRDHNNNYPNHEEVYPIADDGCVDIHEYFGEFDEYNESLHYEYDFDDSFAYPYAVTHCSPPPRPPPVLATPPMDGRMLPENGLSFDLSHMNQHFRIWNPFDATTNYARSFASASFLTLNDVFP